MREFLLELLRCPHSGSELRLEAFERDGDEVVSGVLAGEAGEFPVVDGIPVFCPAGATLDLLRSGRSDEALAEAALHDRPAGGLRLTTTALVGVPGVTRLAAKADRRVAEYERRSAWQHLRPGRGTVWDGLRYALLERRPKLPDAFAYFRYRYAMPRHLVGLAVLQVPEPVTGPVLDLGCGLGHMTWSVARHWPDAQMVGLDGSFLQLWAARRLVGSSPNFVCGDARWLPLRSGAFGAVTAFDVFSFVTAKWSAAREALRVLDTPGFLAITSVTNRLRRHEYAGEPLSPDGWNGLLVGAQHRVVPDNVILKRYLQGRGIPDDVAPRDVAASRLVTLLARRGEGGLGGPEVFGEWPHARGGALAVNPLFRPEPRPGGGVRYVRSFPAGSYAPDNPELMQYLPETFELEAADLAAARRGEQPLAVIDAVAKAAVLALPDGYVANPWPGPITPAGAATTWTTFQPEPR